MSFYFLGYFILGFFAFKLIYPKINNMLIDSKCTKENYKGEIIPNSMGMVFIPIISFLFIVNLVFFSTRDIIYFLFFIGALGMGFVGFVDDLLGNRSTTGLRGHLKALLMGNLTTGMFKAILGGAIAFSISVIISTNLRDIIINTIIISLFTNLINLLDLRPGRATKGFLIISFILLIINPVLKHNSFLYGLAGSVVGYFPHDNKGKTMMGDVGSNILGISIGIVSSLHSLNIRLTFLVLLILVHIYTEKYSLTKAIEKNRVLKYIDDLGR